MSKESKFEFELKTPVGTGYIQFGHWMPGDDRAGKYHCWWNGCGIGGDSKKLSEAKKYLVKFIRHELTRQLNKYEEQATDIRLFLREI